VSTSPSPAAPGPTRWTAISTDPNAAATVGHRVDRLDAAWRAVRGVSRDDALASYARGRKTVDLGCVDHYIDILGADNPQWLHAKIAAVASEVVGVDYDVSGIEKMRRLGFDAVHHDITRGPGPLRDRAPFETIIAGEIIEHVADQQALLEAARGLLSSGGLIVLSTPNPYAPWRVRAGQLRRPYESVDHVNYLFPSGMAELADRSGLVLREAYSLFFPRFRDTILDAARAVKGRLGGRKRHEPQLWPFGLDLPDVYVTPWQWLVLSRRRSRGWLGEYAIYVLERP
jgi:SAM-dependent methyltransferase